HNSDLDEDDMEIFVESAPLSFATITHDFFTIPALDSMFPSLTGPPTTPQKSLEAPTSFDAQTRQLAASLITLLDALSVREEFFVLGETSRTLARCIISQSSTDTPRRNPTNPNSIAVLLMDRSLDLSVVAGRGDNLLDTIFRELESYEGLGPLDKKVDVSVYGSTYPYPLSIAHSVELDAMDFLKVV
ncbi:Sec1 domain-containing protein 2, partial [Rhizoclosmatium hyalinum]